MFLYTQPIFSRKNLSNFLKKEAIFLAKKRGQNFLLDKKLINKIIDLANLSVYDEVIEVGGGLGHLSIFIAPLVKNLIIFEIDRKLYKNLVFLFKGYKNVTVIFDDALKSNWNDYFSDRVLGKRILISNVPYCISSPLIEKAFQYFNKIDKLILTLQKDFALRIVANENSDDYSVLSIFVSVYSIAKKHFNIYPNAFFPVPNVESSVVTLDTSINFINNIDNFNVFRCIVKLAFSQRRKIFYKIIKNNRFFNIDENNLNTIFRDLSISKNSRAEKLSVKTFISLSNKLTKYNNLFY